MPSPLFGDRYAAVVAALAEARRQAGVTQVQLAERLQRPQSYVSKVERRERRVDVIEFIDWVSALGLDPAEIFSRVLARERHT
jgi:transcriptional regulator with XRE-family HTH domain